ncbi:hypothetical protein [Kitasatospora sp. NPDC050463]|uniref:hypothetical protein n=1 Tax=Kitasatospora sp. NPDC050463 TaxID=3155786 RepID=UPI0033C6BC10
MRVQDIQTGETYQVKVPQRLPPALRHRPVHTPSDFYADMRLIRLRGGRFELTVTAVDPDAATVDGYEATTITCVSIQLTDDQAILLGLPTETTYEIIGFVSPADQEHGEDNRLPRHRPLHRPA